MSSLYQRTPAALAAAALFLAGQQGHAQGVPPAGAYGPAVGQPTATTQVSAPGTVLPPITPTPVVNTPAYSPSYSAGAYGYPVYQSPVNGYLTGAADLTNANAQYQVTIQQARIAREQSYQAQVDTRRRQFDERRYEQALTPTYEEQRQMEQLQALNRARHNPPRSEVWSGMALNDLLKALQRGQAEGRQGPPVYLEPTLLAHVNLTGGANYAGAGMLKDLTRFRWPLPLKGSTFDGNRKKVETLARLAVDQAPSGSIDDDTLQGLNTAVKGMMDEVDGQVASLTPTDYVRSKRYLRELKESFRVLQDPNVANYFSRKYQAQGPTAADLVRQMTTQGLTFAPAVSGDEPSYTALFSALVAYDIGLNPGGQLSALPSARELPRPLP